MTNSGVTNAEYWKDNKNSGYGQVLVGKTKVELISTLPKDLNENLLGTLSIEASMQPSTTTTTTGPNGVHKPRIACVNGLNWAILHLRSHGSDGVN